jgi:mannose-6-phosphate isomerase-like protein (cupin superfamily)
LFVLARPRRQRFSFAGTSFDAVIAHGGGAPILTRRVFEGRDASRCRFVDLTVVPRGADIGVHTHETDNHELYVVIEGRGRMHLDGEEFEVGPGDVIMNRPGGTHGLRNLGEGELKLVVVEVTAKAEPR